MQLPMNHPASRPPARAFTMVELMISIALVLILMVGINQVFKVTGEAVGTGQAVSTGVRDARSAQSIFADDFASVASDSPAMIIRSQRVSAFRNRLDQLRDQDYASATSVAARDRAKLTIDVDGRDSDGDTNPEGDSNVPGELISPATYNFRSHRVDQIRFFGRGLFRRQTGGGLTYPGGAPVNEFVSTMTAPEAWITYGHLRRPDQRRPLTTNQQFEHRGPGDEPDVLANQYNDDNYYASDWILGRMQLCLVEPDGDNRIVRNGISQHYIARTGIVLAPLSLNSRWNQGTDWLIQWSRFDLAGTSINGYRSILQSFITGGGTEWYNALGNWRFQGDPRPMQPVDDASVARTVPAFLQHCSQFIIEYAGDFVTQDLTGPTAGHITDFAPDGHIDFIVFRDAAGVETRRIRWYGMPRNVDTSDDIGTPMIKGVAAGTNPRATQANELLDVVPLRDVLSAAAIDPTTVHPLYFERELPIQRPNYSHPNLSSGLQPNEVYMAAWGPDTDALGLRRPSMIRIVFTIEDPEGRIADGQTFEYVFRVGG